jgi:hypothetical protein
MPKRIPIKAANNIAQEYNCTQVLLLAFDGELTHCVTYGKTKADCAVVTRAQDFWNGRVLPPVIE